GGGAGTHVLVAVEDRDAVDVLDGHDRAVEPALVPRLGGETLRALGVAVHVLTREALDGGAQVGTDALRREVGVVVGGRVHGPGATVGAHRHARHRLDPTGEDDLVPAGADLLRGHVDRAQAGGAEAVDLHTGHGVGHLGGEHRNARQ